MQWFCPKDPRFLVTDPGDQRFVPPLAELSHREGCLMNSAASIRKPALGALAVSSFFAMFVLVAELAHTQQVTGTLGQADATTTINGKQIPEPPPKFGGVIKDSAKDSTPWWPPRVVPPKGAPNILLIMTDDQGYGVPSTFGG